MKDPVQIILQQFPIHRVPWLQGHFKNEIVRDDDDVWKKSLRTQTSSEAAEIEDEWRFRNGANMALWMITRAIQILGRDKYYSLFNQF